MSALLQLFEGREDNEQVAHSVGEYSRQRAAGAKPSWAVNDEQQQGLLRLPLLTPPLQYRAVLDEIEDAGYRVVDHDVWYLHMDGYTYYLLLAA